MIIFISGPPRCGKDTAITFIMREYPSTFEYKCSRPLKDGLKGLFQIDGTELGKYIEVEKDNEVLYGMTPRQVQIDLFRFLEERFGEDILGQIANIPLAKTLAKNSVVDAGRNAEVKAIRDHFKLNNVRGLNIERSRCDYAGDSREHIDFDRLEIPNKTINNRHDIEMYEVQVLKAVEEWL